MNETFGNLRMEHLNYEVNFVCVFQIIWKLVNLEKLLYYVIFVTSFN